MSITKKKIVVPTVEKEKPENAEEAKGVAEAQPASVDTGKGAETKPTPPSSEPSFVGAESVFAKVDKNMLEKLDLLGAGDLIRAIIPWMQGVDAKFNVVGSAMQQIDKRFEGLPTEDSIANKFMEKLNQERAKALASRLQPQPLAQNQPIQQEPPQQSSGSELSQLLNILGQGGGGNSDASNYFMQLGMRTASMSEFMQKEMFKTMMPKAFVEWEKQQTAGKT